MRDRYYAPLTPDLRKKANEGIDNEIAVLRTCKPNELVNMQINAWNAAKIIINGLPDGFLMPMIRRR